MQNDKKGGTTSRTLVLFFILNKVKDLKATKHSNIQRALQIVCLLVLGCKSFIAFITTN